MRRLFRSLGVLLVLVAFCLVAAGLPASMGGLPQAAEPALANPNFEEGFSERGAPELLVANSWTWWAVEQNEWHRPEYKAETREIGSGRVYEGSSAQKTFVTYAKHDGGLTQTVQGLEIGEWYTFSCHVYNWCSAQDNPDQSVGGKCQSMVGVNPWGNAWPADWTTIWGKAELNNYNKWVDVQVTFEAWSPKAAVFIRGLGEWPIKHLDWYWDACSFGLTQGPSVTPVPTPTSVPPVGVCPDGVAIRSIVETVVAERDPVRWP